MHKERWYYKKSKTEPRNFTILYCGATHMKVTEVSNHWQLGCLFVNLFSIATKKSSKFRRADPFWGDSNVNPMVTKAGVVMWKTFPCHAVIVPQWPWINEHLKCTVISTDAERNICCCRLYHIFTTLNAFENMARKMSPIYPSFQCVNITRMIWCF